MQFYKTIYLQLLLSVVFCLSAIVVEAQVDSLLAQVSFLSAEGEKEKAARLTNSYFDFYMQREDWEVAAKLLLEKIDFTEKGQAVVDLLNGEEVQKLMVQLPDNDLKARIWCYQAINLARVESYAASITYYDKSLGIYEKSQSQEAIVAWTYRFAIQSAIRILDYEKTNTYARRLLEVDTTKRYHLGAYSYLAMAANFQKKFKEASEYYDKGISLKGRLNHRLRLMYQGTIANAHLGETETVDLIRNNILQLFKNENITDEDEWGGFYRTSGEVYNAMGAFPKAIANYQKGLSTYQEIFTGQKNRELAKLHCLIGDAYSAMHQTDKALNEYQQALIQVFPDFNETDIHQTPPLAGIYSEPWIMTAAKRKGEALLKKYKQTQDPIWLHSAIPCYQLSLTGSTNLRSFYNDDDGKLYLQQYNSGALEEAIYSHFLLYNHTKDTAHLHKAYSYSEAHKSIVLREAIHRNNALATAGVPDSLLEKEKQCHAQVLQWKMKINQEKSKLLNADQVEIERMKNELSIAQNKHWALLRDIETNSERYQNIIQQNTSVGLQKIQDALLNDNTALLQFYWGKKNVFAFFIQKDNIELTAIPQSDSLQNELRSFLDLLSNRVMQEQNPALFFAQAASLGNQFYKALIPANTHLKKLIIIPDGLLAYLPFEALITEDWSGSYAHAPFLLHQIDCQYAYAPSMLLPMNNEVPNRKGALGVAPVFEEQQRGLATLPESILELEDIPFRPLKILAHSQASLFNFKKEVVQYQIIHCSTHASANDDGLPPRIELADTSLFLPTLYTMRIPAELVVLSACESIVGKYENGEGVMSLSRGFAYAGAGSLIASLWSVNEKSTQDVFRFYYENIKELAKGASLTEARRQYLLSESISDRYKSPYYWAGFIFTGREGFIHSDTSWPVSPWYFGLLGFCWFGFAVAKKRLGLRQNKQEPTATGSRITS